MAKIRSTGTTPEARLFDLTLAVLGRRRKILRNAVDWEGTPDIVIPSLNLALFADGCFFHGCPQHCRIPATNREYWERKIARNRQRDRSSRRWLRSRGVSVWQFWEHDLKPSRSEHAAKRLERAVAACLDRQAGA